MTKYLIVDDEHIAHNIIKNYCDLLPNMEFKQSCYDAIEALEYLKTNAVDLIFLDLNMPKLKGFDFLKILPNPPKVIVTTAYSEYALEGFELNVVDYLLKPFGFDRFIKAVNKALSSEKTVQAPSSNISKESKGKKIFLRSNKKYNQVDLDTIRYVEASGNYCKVFTIDTVITIREKISTLLEILESGQFIQVHKSFVVAVDHINSIEGNRIMMGEDLIPIGKMYKLKVNELLK